MTRAALRNTDVGDVITPALRKYSDEVEGLWVGDDPPDDPRRFAPDAVVTATTT